jgi:hypothetical protein
MGGDRMEAGKMGTDKAVREAARVELFQLRRTIGSRGMAVKIVSRLCR